MASNPSIIAPSQLSIQSMAAINGGGNFQNGPTYTLANLSPPGPPPQMIDQLAESTNPQVLSYPADSPPYFFKLDILKYSRQDWLSVGTTTPSSWIVLPLPSSMIDEGGVSYNTEPLGALQGNLVGAADRLLKLGSSIDFKSAVAAVSGSVPAEQMGGAALNQLTNVAQAQALIAAAGAAVNQFQVVALKGPTFKKRQFAWKFSPKTPAESEDSPADYSKVEQLQRTQSSSGLRIGLF